ncbi:MAG: hypothetical protein KBD97_05580, partial [Bacteroidaceae bacterium]|nr:hypothetical protein [Bacteroidaceae bacterium]
MRRFIIGLFIAFFSAGYLSAQQSINLAGQWGFQTDRNDLGITKKWYEQKQSSDFIELPGSMVERMKGDPITAETVWTGSLYDSSYYYSPA